ncbi:response regulator [Phosphitispora fastidiosa]|uniref:response regulator n=1 Tax=Phosphitispora fastidiosa TaxID=2837202 RepID=UPI001E439930|nr:response regulator [Phosphitispora fastidiosa]MBU7006025.1 two-component SAPR family response regulator [Phosphitispora fastidiosa]
MIRAIIVEDERPSADKMEKLLRDSGIVEITGKFTNPVEALEFIKKVKIDAAFLDIEMPELDGFQLANHILDLQSWAAVVFVTAYNGYAVEAFHLNALDYLMKPVDKDRLQETLDRIIQEKEIQMNPSQMQVRCFGRFKVIIRSSEVKFRTGKAEELLAYFIDCKGREVSRNEIIDRLWPDYDGDRAVTHFNTTLHYVRKALLRNGIQVSIEHLRGSYRLDTSSIDCDGHRFLTRVSAADKISDITISEYEETAALYTGDYLGDNEFQWAERNKMLYREKYIRLIIKMADYYKTAGNYSRLVELLKTGLTHESLHSILNYRLIEALLAVKDTIAAVQYYDIYKRGLKNDLGLEPEAKFKKLMRQN